MLGLSESATGNFGFMFNCDQYGTGFNLTMYCNPQVDEFNTQASRELDLAARRELLIQAENLIHDDLAVAIIRYNVASIGYTTRLHNFYPNPFQPAAAAAGGVAATRLWIDE